MGGFGSSRADPAPAPVAAAQPEVSEDYDITRMQIYVKDQHMVALRFAKALHFEVECKLRKFGPEGADYYSMARFK